MIMNTTRPILTVKPNIISAQQSYTLTISLLKQCGATLGSFNALLFNLARAQRVFTKNIRHLGIFQFNCAILLLVDDFLEPLEAWTVLPLITMNLICSYSSRIYHLQTNFGVNAYIFFSISYLLIRLLEGGFLSIRIRCIR